MGDNFYCIVARDAQGRVMDVRQPRMQSDFYRILQETMEALDGGTVAIEHDIGQSRPRNIDL
jgi:hypothetical protein